MEVDISVYIYQRVVGDEDEVFVAWNWDLLDVAEQDYGNPALVGEM